MMTPAASAAEQARLQALRQLRVLDTPPEREFESLVAAAALVCGMPISLLSLIDADRQWFKAQLGLPGVSETPREWAFCAHAIEQDGIFEVSDARADPRFANNPLVTGDPDIRFYAGATLRLSNGAHVGTLCVIDRKPGQLNAMQRAVLGHLAAAAVQALEAHRFVRDLAASDSRFRALSEAAPLGIFATDGEGRCNYTNARWQGIFGMSDAQAQGHGWAQALHPDDSAAAMAEWHRAAQSQRDFDMEFRVRHADGSVRHVHSVARPVIDDNGQVTDYIGSIEDVTQRVLQHQALEDAHERMTLATDSGGIGVWDFDLRTGVLHWDAWMYRLFGLSPTTGRQAYGYEHWRSLLHPDDAAAADEELSAAVHGTGDYDSEFRIIWPDGSLHHIRAAARVARDADGNALRLVGVNWDVTPMRQLSHELAEQHELLHVTLQSIGDAVITTDADSRITWLNPVAERMTGWPTAEALGLPLTQVFHIINETTRQLAINPVAACLQPVAAKGMARDTVLVARDGREYGIEDSAAPIRNGRDEVLGVVLVFHDVTEQRRLSGEMRYRATHDALTGLLNRSEFESRLRRTLKKAQDDATEHALLYIDLDQFKLINDACGHAVGDQLLQQVAKLLAETVRARDTLARLGGDEFAVILEYCTSEQAHRVAQQICDRMEGFRHVHGEQRFRIGTSIGLVPLDQRWASAAAALQAADTACYAAKDAGRNRVHAWFDSDQAMLARQGEMQWATRLEQALDEDRFVLFAQRLEPLTEAGSGLVAEVLIRLRDADGSLIPPGAFLPAAERFHLATRIDRWVLRHALAQLQALPDISVVRTLCINLSGQSVGDRAFHRHAIEVLAAAGPDVCSRVCLEITETAAVTNMADATVFIDQVRALGVSIALDDFGAGASSFGYLKTLTVDKLKIDGQFIKNLTDDLLNDAAVRCFVNVAQVVGMQTVAEFVDRPETLQRVRELGVDYAQGYLLHRPEAIERVLGTAA